MAATIACYHVTLLSPESIHQSLHRHPPGRNLLSLTSMVVVPAVDVSRQSKVCHLDHIVVINPVGEGATSRKPWSATQTTVRNVDPISSAHMHQHLGNSSGMFLIKNMLEWNFLYAWKRHQFHACSNLSHVKELNNSLPIIIHLCAFHASRVMGMLQIFGI